MLRFILDLTFWQGLSITVTVICIAGVIVILGVKKYTSHLIGKEHEKIGRLLFRVTAGLMALLISLSYANERVAQGKVIDSIGEEASLIVNTVFILDMVEDEKVPLIRQRLREYIALNLDSEWKNVETDPYHSEAVSRLKDAYALTMEISTVNKGNEEMKARISNNLDRIIQLMQVRIYSYATLIPNLVYTLLLGMFLMWIFFTVYKLDAVSLLFITLYNLFLGTLIYFILALSNPLAGPLKIEAQAFETIQTKGIENNPALNQNLKSNP